MAARDVVSSRPQGRILRVPAYAPDLAARHRAHRRELRKIVRDLPIPAGGRVLDVACGDGAYLRWLAERVGSRGLVVGIDRSAALLRIGARALRRLELQGRIRRVQAGVGALPFADGAFDVAWCAQSLVSLRDATAVLREAGRVVRPGGAVAVLENDALHDVLLPWPVDLELALLEADLRASLAEESGGRNHYVARRLEALFRQAGLTPERRTTYAVDRRAPLAPADGHCLEAYLARLRERVVKRLPRIARRELEQLCRPDSPDYLLYRRDLFVTWLQFVVLARK